MHTNAVAAFFMQPCVTTSSNNIVANKTVSRLAPATIKN